MKNKSDQLCNLSAEGSIYSMYPQLNIANKLKSIMNTTIRIFSSTVFTVLLFVGFLAVGGCTISGSNFETNDEPYRVERFNVAPGGELYVKTSGGSIKVEGGNGSEVKVEVFVRSSRWKGDRLEEELRENYELSVEKSGNRVEAIAERTSKSWTGSGISISFVVKVPTEFECDLKTSGGSISLTGITGDKEKVKTSGGSLNLSDIKGDVEAHTSGGSINVDEFSGSLYARTSGGSIKIDDARGDIDVSTSGGSIKLYGLSGSVTAHTSGGSITAELDQLEEQLSLKTSGGSVKAIVPSGLGLDLDLRGNKVNTKLSNFSGESKNNKVVGTINGGGIPVNLATSGGSVTLEFN